MRRAPSGEVSLGGLSEVLDAGVGGMAPVWVMDVWQGEDEARCWPCAAGTSVEPSRAVGRSEADVIAACLAQLERDAIATGGTKQSILRVTFELADLSLKPLLNEAWVEFLGGDVGTRSNQDPPAACDQ